MKATIFGLGRMGQAIAWAMDTLGHDVTCVDTFPNEFRLTGLIDNFKFIQAGKPADYTSILSDKPDIVISSMPYHQLWPVASYCIDNNIRYCDLGGRVDVSKKINDYASNKKNGKPVFTDLGLAPGWVNIIAEHGIRRMVQADHVKMMVGGLPQAQNLNPLNYLITWSVDGLINEYRDDCLVLQDGKTKTVPGMDGLESVNTDELGELEAFYTSGGASHTIHSMKSRGVKNCTYKTLRYKGHRDIIQWLIRKCKLDDEALGSLFVSGCETDDKDDLVIVRVELHKEKAMWKHENVVRSDEHFSAMQKCTAFPIASVADILTTGKLDDRVVQKRSGEVKLSNCLKYSDIDFDEFQGNLNTLLNK
tara:strand:+ start:2043 stop:3131 length:1089 start_codon:yes stop_codon:yes gene_type:complete